MIGIYKITNPVDEVYIGKSTNIESRINHHKLKSSNKLLRKSIETYGFENHKIEIICECELIDLNIKEAEFIKEYSFTHVLFNSEFYGSNSGRKAIPNAVRKNWYIPKNRVDEIEKIVRKVQNEEILKEAIKNRIRN